MDVSSRRVRGGEFPMLIRRTSTLCIFMVLASAAVARAQESATDVHFKQIYTDDWAWRRSSTGSADDESEGRGRGVRAHLPKVDLATQEAKLQHEQQVLRELDTVDVKQLSPANQVNYEVFRPQIEVLLNQQKFKDYEKPLNSDSGFWNAVTGGERRQLRTEQDYRNYISMLKDVPRYFNDEIVNMRAGLKRGFTPPQVTLIGRDAPVADVADAKSPEECSLYAPFRKMPAGMPEATQKELQAEGLAAVRDSALPAFQTLLTFLRKEYIPGARKELAAWSMPDGKAYYQSKIYEFTTTDDDAGRDPPDRAG